MSFDTVNATKKTAVFKYRFTISLRSISLMFLFIFCLPLYNCVSADKLIKGSPFVLVTTTLMFDKNVLANNMKFT